MMKTNNILNLPNLKVKDMKEFEDDYRFLVESIAPPPSHCPKCGTVPNLYKHGTKEQLFFDLPMHAKRVGLTIKRNDINVMSVKEPSLKIFPTLMKIVPSLLD